jgi:Uri superfamily endonuclease
MELTSAFIDSKNLSAGNREHSIKQDLSLPRRMPNIRTPGCRGVRGKNFLFPEYASYINSISTYIYSGSARRNIEARVARHKAKSKKMRRHIDYLLSHSGIRLIRVELFAESECALNKRIGGQIVALRFGATDCRNRRRSHLKYFDSGKVEFVPTFPG